MAVSWQQINCQVDLTIWAIFLGKKVNASGISLGSWIMSAPTGRTNAEDETPLLWPPNGKSWLPAKIPDAGKDWRQEEKGTTEDEMVGWHHQFNGHEFEQIPVSSEGQGSLECCSPWGCKESATTEHISTCLTMSHKFLCFFIFLHYFFPFCSSEWIILM